MEKLNRKLESEIHDKNEFIRAISHDLGAPLRNPLRVVPASFAPGGVRAL